MNNAEKTQRDSRILFIYVFILIALLASTLLMDRIYAQEVLEGEGINPEGESIIQAPKITNFAPAYLAAKGIVVNREQEEDRRFDLIMKQLIQIRNDCK